MVEKGGEGNTVTRHMNKASYPLYIAFECSSSTSLTRATIVKCNGDFDNLSACRRLGFSLLFYGYGSKKAILDRFGTEACRDGGVLVVNGWAHHLTLRGLLLKVVATLRKGGVQSTR